MPTEPRPDAVVLRFTPMSAQGVLDRSRLDARRADGKGHHTASVWADHARPSESRDDLLARLLAVTELNGLVARRNPTYWWCTTAQELLDLGFTFEKDEYVGEPKEHYSVVLGDPPRIEDAARFVSAFARQRRSAQ